MQTIGNEQINFSYLCRRMSKTTLDDSVAQVQKCKPRDTFV